MQTFHIFASFNLQSNLGLNDLLKKAMGWPFWDKIAPMSTPDASGSKVNGREKSGNVKIGVVVKASFKAVKAWWASWDHSNESFVVNLFNGAVIEAYPQINLR